MPTLDWLNRASAFNTAARVPYRLLEQVSVHTSPVRPEPVDEFPASTGSARTEIHDNLLIQGDNLEALKALLPFYRGQVKCIFIDPPYNTKSAFEHYDDNLEHTQWLSMMLPRLQLLRELLREDGSIWVTIDDNEGHYLKVLMDEVFGRGNFVANVVWQKRFSPNSTAIHLSDSHDHVLVFAKLRASWNRNLLARTEKSDSIYKNLDNDPRGDWTSSDLSARNFYSLGTYPVVTPAGRQVSGPPPGRYWGVSEQTLNELRADNRVWWGKTGDGQPRLKRFLHEVQEGVVPQTVWLNDDVGHTQEAKKEVVAFNPTNVFTTPKPERLIQRVLQLATNENDLILDSFLGSGTTAAVAHKMGRRWIGIEMGEHAATHCLPRLQKVIDGEQGGISKAVNWAGGGGFRFMRLGEAVFDEAGRINPAVRFATLAAFVWQQETGTAFDALEAKPGTPYLGTYYEFDSCSRTNSLGEESNLLIKTPQFACYLLFNGILKDKRPASGNVLTQAVLDALLTLHATTPEPTAPLLVYGEACRLGAERLKQAKVTFKHIPYDVRAR
jgi:adenine-specific DNA-methyltransferase